jgi:hypothetical protein
MTTDTEWIIRSTEKAAKAPYQLKAIIRPTTTVKDVDDLGLESYCGLGVLQKRDLDVAMACFDHRIFIKYHFDELRLKKWLNGAMHVFQIHSPERGGIRVHGTIITDSNMDLIAYCVENKPSASLQIRGNRTKTVEAIKKLCRYESWSTRV